MCRPSRFRTEARGFAGFTLVELMVAIGIVVAVLGTAYQILINTIDAQRRLARLARPEKIGDAILSVLRRDLESAVSYGLGERVFLGEDQGEGVDARDAIHFVSTVEPTPTADEEYQGLMTSHMVSVSYVLAENAQGEGLTLFRREGWDPEGSDILDGGTYREVYNRLAYLNFAYMDVDGEWFDTWDSEERADLMEIIGKAPEPIIGGGLGREKEASDRGGARGRSSTASSKAREGGRKSGQVGRAVPIRNPLDPLAEGEDESELPDPGIPKAVRVEFGIYAGDEHGLWRDAEGNPLVYHFSGTVQILASEVLEIRADLPAEAAGGQLHGIAASGEGGAEGIRATGPVTMPGEAGRKGGIRGPGRRGPPRGGVPGRRGPGGGRPGGPPGGFKVPPGAMRGGVPKNLPAGLRR